MLPEPDTGPRPRRLGRPRKDPAELRTLPVRVFCSPGEKLKLSRDAAACGLAPAEYIRRLIAGHRLKPDGESSADPRLLLELNAIGNNLNQTVTLVRDHPRQNNSGRN